MKGDNNKARSRSSMASLFLAVAMVTVLLTQQVREAGAVTCDPLSLLSCESAIEGTSNPSTSCCSALKQQSPCFCQYIKNPAYGSYVSSPKAKTVAADCGVTIPTNCSPPPPPPAA